MDIKTFAKKHRLKLHRSPDDGTEIIRGRKGNSHLFEYDDGVLAVMIMPETLSAHRWSAARAAFTKAGMQIRQNGDCEGTATFDPSAAHQVRVALKHAGIRRGRKLSPAQQATLAIGRQKARLNKSVSPLVKTGGLAPRNDDRLPGEALAPPAASQDENPRFNQEIGRRVE